VTSAIVSSVECTPRQDPSDPLLCRCDDLSRYPWLELVLGGGEGGDSDGSKGATAVPLTLQPSDYLEPLLPLLPIKRGGGGGGGGGPNGPLECFVAIRRLDDPNGSSEEPHTITLGSTLLKAYYTEFDYRGRRVGFARTRRSLDVGAKFTSSAGSTFDPAPDRAAAGRDSSWPGSFPNLPSAFSSAFRTKAGLGLAGWAAGVLLVWVSFRAWDWAKERTARLAASSEARSLFPLRLIPQLLETCKFSRRPQFSAPDNACAFFLYEGIRPLKCTTGTTTILSTAMDLPRCRIKEPTE
jgi:hypothetical protein